MSKEKPNRRGNWYRKVDNPQVKRFLNCPEKFARENGWMPVESVSSTNKVPPVVDDATANVGGLKTPSVSKEPLETDEMELPTITPEPKPKEPKASAAKTAVKRVNKRGPKPSEN